jgi:hypothetical protein
MEQAARAALALMLAFTMPVYADVQVLHKGQPAPYDGFLFDAPAEQQAEKDRADADFYHKLSDKQAEKINLEDNESQILEKRLQLYITESNALARDKASTESTERIYLLGAFALGVIATGFAVRNVRP